MTMTHLERYTVSSLLCPFNFWLTLSLQPLAYYVPSTPGLLCPFNCSLTLSLQLLDYSVPSTSSLTASLLYIHLSVDTAVSPSWDNISGGQTHRGLLGPASHSGDIQSITCCLKVHAACLTEGYRVRKTDEEVLAVSYHI